MNKRVYERYKKILNNIVNENDYSKTADLFHRADYETGILFSRLTRYDYLEYNYLNEEQAFMITFFSYLVCVRGMASVMTDMIKYITENKEFFDIKENDIWNINLALKKYVYYLDDYTFKISLLNMIAENKLKFSKTYNRNEILFLKKFV